MTRFSSYEPTAVANKAIDAGADTMPTVRTSDSFLTISHSVTICSETESSNSGERALDDSISEREVTWNKSSPNHCAADSFYQVNQKHFIEDHETDERTAYSVERTQTKDSSSECCGDREDADLCTLTGGDGGGPTVWTEVRVASGEEGVDGERVDDWNDHKGGTTHRKVVGSVPSFDSLVLEPTHSLSYSSSESEQDTSNSNIVPSFDSIKKEPIHSLSYSSSVGYTDESEQDTRYSNMSMDFTQASSSSREKYTNESEEDSSLSLFDDHLLAMRARLSQSIVSSSKLLMAQNISKDNVVAQNGALEDKAREQRSEINALPPQGLRKIEEATNDLVRERNKLIKEVEVHSYQQLAHELEACRADNEALRAENEELRAQVDVRRFSFYKPSPVTSKEALELEACRAENDALRAQVSDLLRSRDEDRKERLLEAMKMSESSEESSAKAAADEVQTLRDAYERLRIGAQRDSERIAKLVDEVRTLTHAAKAVVIAAKSCRSSAKAKATAMVSVGSTVRSVESSVGSASGYSLV